MAEQFDTCRVVRARFSGRVSLGAFKRTFTLPGGVELHSGLYDVRLHHVEVGDDCLLRCISGYVAHYRIDHDSLVSGCGQLYTEGRSTFGNGTRVAVLDETGSRTVIITDQLTAQTAKLMADSTPGSPLQERLQAMYLAYAASRESDMGYIGCHASLIDVGTLTNVSVGAYATLCGARLLVDGTIASTPEAPTYIGHDVRLRHFIVGSGAHIDGAASLTACFVGQAAHIDGGFSATQSLFFCNCQMECGEACAVFAGPFTVSHHKATLLIGGEFSFANAGSGTNQSNHLYKAGPIHYGRLSRGCKTGSGSHIVWPAAIGAFTMVTGRVDTHPDTRLLPFSYLMGSYGEAQLVPAANLFTLGTLRDGLKWPKRDLRTDLSQAADITDCSLLNPYTVGLITKAIDLLTDLMAQSGADKDQIAYSGVHIRRSAIAKALRQYRTAVDFYLGSGPWVPVGPKWEAGAGEWTDLSGMIAPQTAIAQLEDGLVDGEIGDARSLNEALQDLQSHRAEYEQAYRAALAARLYGPAHDAATAEEVRGHIESAYRRAADSLLHLIDTDARKELWMTYFHLPPEERQAAVRRAPTHPDIVRLSQKISLPSKHNS